MADEPRAYHGKDGKIFLSPTGGTDWTEIGKISTWGIDMTRDKVDTTALGDANKTYVAGLKNVAGTFSGFFTGDEELFDAADAPNGVYLALCPSTLTPDMCWRGPAWLDVSIASGVSAAVTINGTFSANGAWSRGAMPTVAGAPLGTGTDTGIVGQSKVAA